MAEESAFPSLASWARGDGIEFADEAAAAQYRERAQRMVDAVTGETPDRVPVNLLCTFYPAFHAGKTPAEVMHDPEALQESLLAFVEDLDPDLFPWGSALIPAANALETVQYEGFDWPGDGSSPRTVYQARERDYMTVEDYDLFLANPGEYFLRRYVPEVFGELEGFAQFPQFANLTAGIAGTHPFLLSFGLPQMQESLETLMEAGEQALAWEQAISGTVQEIVAAGYPQSVGGLTLAPYDMLGDMMRGTHEVMMDLKRRPEVLSEAVDRLTPLAIDLGLAGAQVNQNPFVFIPLHKGADGFMSGEEFEEFYWPSLRAVLDALMAEDLVPWLFAEGSYTSRLESIRDMPEGPIIWHFQDTDLREAQEVLPEFVTVAGDVSTSLLNTREPEAVTEYCQQLVADVGTERFVLAPAVGLDEAEPENVRAMFESVR